MRLIALLSWFDESPTWLAATVASLKGMCDTVVAVDGRYDLFPAERDVSGPEQHDAIRETAHACGIGSLIYAPQRPWLFNEVGKRNRMFRLAAQIARHDIDWYLVIDADERVTKAPDDLRVRLKPTAGVGNVRLWWHNDPAQIGPLALEHDINQYGETIAPRLFRASPLLRYEGWHGNVMTPHTEEVGLEGFYIEHRHAHRDLHRRRQQGEYITARHEAHAETLPA